MRALGHERRLVHVTRAREPGLKSRSRSTQLRQIAASPLTLLVFAWMLLIGGSMAGAVGVACALGVAIVAAAASTRSRTLAGWADRRARRDERRRRIAERLAFLDSSSRERQEQFRALNQIVEQLEDAELTCTASVQIEVLGLQGLLDRYVALAAGHASLMDAAGRADQRLLMSWSDAISAAASETTSELRRDVLSRRGRHKQDCHRRAIELGTKMEAIVDFILLVNQKAATRQIDDDLEEELSWRLADLDAQEAAERAVRS